VKELEEPEEKVELQKKEDEGMEEEKEDPFQEVAYQEEPKKNEGIEEMVS